MTAGGPARDADPLAAYVPRVLQAWPAGRRTQAVEGSLVSADISGFTALSERLAELGREGAEELTTLLNVCFSGMIAAARARGGDVLAFGGDALLLLFTGDGHTERACGATAAMRAIVEAPVTSRTAGEVQLGISIGVHTGTFHLLLVPAGFDALVVAGPDASACVRAEGDAPRGGILLTAAAAAGVPPAWLGEEAAGGRLLSAQGAEAAGALPAAGASVAEGAGAALARFLPPALVAQVRAGPVHGEHRRVAVGFLEFAGTDARIAAGGGDEVADLLAQVGAALATACRRTGAHVLATDLYPDGGKFIVAAGAPVSTGDDAAALLRTLREVVDRDPGLSLRAGANRGPVFLGPLGSSERRSLTVMGDAVNLAARLMQAAHAGQVIASAGVLADSTTTFETEPLPPFTVKGKAEPVHAATVGHHHGQATTAVDSSTTLVGRDDVLARLQDHVARGGAITLVGPTGSGKSRLLHELTTSVAPLVHVLVADRFEADLAHRLTRRLLHHLLDIDPGADPVRIGEVLREAVDAHAPDLRPWVPLLAVPAGAEVPATDESRRIDPQFRRARIEDQTSRLVVALAAGSVLVVDDVHLADAASRRLLQAVATRVPESAAPGSPAPVLVTTREEPAEDDPAVVVPLDPLDPPTVRALVLEVAGDVADRVLEGAVAASGGNPLFAIELARGLGSDEQVPDSVEAVVTARIDRLGPAARALVRDASVLGTEADTRVLGAVLGVEAVTSRRWAGLQDLAEHTGATIRFRHDLYQHVAYLGLSYARRRELHAAAAEALAAAGARPATLSLHHLRAGQHEQAWATARTAGDVARRGDAPAEAAELYGRALTAAAAMADDGAPPAPADHAAVAEAQGDVAELSAAYDQALEAYALARVHVEAPVDDGRLLRKLGTLRVRLGDYDAAMQHYERAAARLEATDGADAVAERARVEVAVAGVWFRRGDYAAAARVAGIAAGLAREVDDLPALAHALYLGDQAAALGGQRHAGLRSEAALAIFAELGDGVGEANVLNNLGVRAYYRGWWDEALDLWSRSRDARERAGDVVGAATQTNNIAEVLADQGRFDEAVRDLTTARRVWRAAGFLTGVGLATSNLGWALVRRGHHAEGVAALREARDQLTAIGAEALAEDATLRLAEALARAGEVDDARALLAAVELGDDATPAAVAAARVRGLALAAEGDDAALAVLDAAVGAAREASAPYELGMVHLARAAVARDPAVVAQARAEAIGVLVRLGVDADALWPGDVGTSGPDPGASGVDSG